MGISNSKASHQNFIKLVSYNVDIENTVTMNPRIDDVFSYFEENLDDFQCDIMCIRGINNFIVYYKLITLLKKKYKKKIYIAPDYYKDNIDITHIYNNEEIKKVFYDNQLPDFAKRKKKKVKNIIISRHKILTTIYSELDDNIIIDDILGIHSIIGVNIVINKKIFSVYNTTLCPDIKYANIINVFARKNEVKTLFDVIKNNIDNLNDFIIQNKNNKDDKDGKKSKPKSYSLSNNHIITGTFNTSTNEYITLISDMLCIDLLNLTKDEDEYKSEVRRNASIYKSCGNVYRDDNVINFDNNDNPNYLSDYVFLYDFNNQLNKKKSDLKYVKKKIYDIYNIYIYRANDRTNFYGSDYISRPSKEVILMIK